MKPLSKEDIIGNAQALSLINLQSLGIAANEDTVKEMRRHYDREHAKGQKEHAWTIGRESIHPRRMKS